MIEKPQTAEISWAVEEFGNVDLKDEWLNIRCRELKEGRRLQLPIYALAARDSLGLGEISSGFYWHIQKKV